MSDTTDKMVAIALIVFMCVMCVVMLIALVVDHESSRETIFRSTWTDSHGVERAVESHSLEDHIRKVKERLEEWPR